MKHRRTFVALALSSALALPVATVAQTDGNLKKAAERIAAQSWWNQPEPVATLDLQDAQRTQIDTLLLRTLEMHRSIRKERESVVAAFEKSLLEGDLDGARSQLANLESLASKLEAAEAKMKLDVLSLLSAEQRTKLTEEMVSGSWIRPGRGGRGGGDGRERTRNRGN